MLLKIMLMQILGFLDLLGVILFGMMYYGLFIKTAALIIGIYLVAKGFLFITSLASYIDLFAGTVLVVSYFFAVPSFLLVIAGLLLLQKSVFSFL
jgi:hypothetical protein